MPLPASENYTFTLHKEAEDTGTVMKNQDLTYLNSLAISCLATGLVDTAQPAFELISDVDSGVCEHFDVWQLKKTFGKEYMGIVRSTFLIGKDGTLKKHWNKVKVKGHAAEVLEAVKELQ